MLHKMFVILMTLGSPAGAALASETSLEFIPVTLGVGGQADCLTAGDDCYLPSTPDSNLLVKNANITILDQEERALSLELSPKDGEALKKLTATHVGEHLAILADGRVVFTGVIKEKLDSHTLKITVQDQKTFDKLVQSLHAKN